MVEIQWRGNPPTNANGLRHKLDKGAATKLEEVRSTFQMTLHRRVGKCALDSAHKLLPLFRLHSVLLDSENATHK